MRSTFRLLNSALSVAIAFAFASVPATAQQGAGYERRELSIPMRDGVSLFAVALIPKHSTTPLPILLIRTPFSAANAFRDTTVPGAYRELAEDGYIFVSEDIRGRFGSGGEFVTLRAQHDPTDPNGVDESTDAFDTIDWLVKNLGGNNGSVGVLGNSYPGWLAALAGIGAHPALRAISPQAPIGDAWMGDDFFHQGAFRQTQGVTYAKVLETDSKGFSGFDIADYDHYDFYLRFPTLDSLARATGIANLPTWKNLSQHPSWDAFWQARSFANLLKRPEVPTLMVGGMWDEEDILGPQLSYSALENADTKDWNRIVLGPWSHNGWLRPRGDSLGPIGLGSNTADWYRANVLRPWFAWYLHGKGDGKFPEAWIFETGENQWHTFDAWPPKNVQPQSLYLRAGGALSFDPPPSGAGQYDSYISDPAHPVPYVPRPDADWVVKLIDVYPDSVAERPAMGGYQLIVNADIMRGRYWNSFTRPSPIPANTVTPFNIDLHQQLYRFRKGHRIMVQVQSTWFPLYDRNPQLFVPSIFHAKPSDFRAQVHRVWHSTRYPSHLSVNVLPPN